MPKISVIVPVYNVEPYLHRCIGSILTQSFADFELILVDDGSPDNCPAICDKYAKMDNRVHVIHQKNGGLSAARNAGLDWAFANSDSEWLTFIDSDDWVDLNYLMHLYNACIEYETQIGICLFDERTEIEDDYSLVQKVEIMEQSWRHLYSVDNHTINVISSCGKLYTKELWREIRFPIGRINEDRFTTHKVLFQTHKAVVVCGVAMYHYCLTPNSIMRSNWTPARLDDLLAVEEQFVFFKENNLPYAYKMTAYSYVCLLQDSIHELNRIAPQYDNYKKFYVKKLAKAIRKYRKLLGLSKTSHTTMYELAYKKKMERYWKRKAIKAILQKDGWIGVVKKGYQKYIKRI